MNYTQAQCTLIAHAEGHLPHVGMGRCPDQLEGHESRDSDCQVCQALIALDLGPHGAIDALAELSAWRERFPSYVYRPQDDCVALK